MVREGAGHGLRRHARPAEGGAARAGWDRLEVDFASAETLADEVLEYGADVVVVEPPEVRDDVVARLERVVGAAR
jgi:proteasome accessory factor B